MSDSIKLKLRIRDANRIVLSSGEMRAVLREKIRNPNLAWQFLERLAETPDHFHDKDHLMMIVNWIPPKGRSFMETARWVQIALLVDAIDEAKEGFIEFTIEQKELLYERMRDPEFKILGTNMAFFSFLGALEKACGEEIYREEVKPKEKKDDTDKGESTTS